MLRIYSRLVGRCLGGICLSLICFSTSAANVDICQQPAAESQLTIAYYNHGRSSIDQGNGATNQENQNFDLLFKSSPDLAFGAAHRYTILDIDQIEPQTNGHLHTTSLALHRYVQTDRGSMRLSIAPTLSASSNVISDPGEYGSDALQVLAAVIWSRPLSDRSSLWYGICGDHRFGSYAIYPTFGFDWRPHADWTIELGYPSSQFMYQVSRSLNSSLRVSPDGNEWYVKDRNLEKQSRLIYEALLLEWSVNWSAHEHLIVTASVGRQLHNRYEMTLMDDSRVRFHSAPVTRIGAALTWRF